MEEAFDWYEQRQSGLGVDFLAAVRKVIEQVCSQPRMHAVVMKDVRKAVLRKYPYIVLYREEQGELVVVSIFHTSRDPADWQSRV